ncbi:MAG: ferritin [Phycisphaerae bacterium]
MMSPKLVSAMSKQLNAELQSSYLYLSMAAWLESQTLRGMAHWMRVQAHEEYAHAMKFFDYLIERGARVELLAVDAPQADWKTPLAMFEHVHAHEQKVTGLIDALAGAAEAAKDRAAGVMLQWFISEQVDEEANASEIVAKLRMAKDSPGGLLQMDHHLGKREGAKC